MSVLLAERVGEDEGIERVILSGRDTVCFTGAGQCGPQLFQSRPIMCKASADDPSALPIDGAQPMRVPPPIDAAVDLRHYVPPGLARPLWPPLAFPLGRSS